MSRPLILLVDSYENARGPLAGVLRDAGFEVQEVHNGVEGLRAARRRRPALVIADLWPFFSASLQMVERLGHSARRRGVPVLVLTSLISAERRLRAVEAGCAGYLEKPCDPARVLEETMRILAAGESTGGRDDSAAYACANPGWLAVGTN